MKVGKYQIGRFHAIIRKEYADGSVDYETSFTDIEDFNEKFGTHFDSEEVDTIGGVIMQAFGYLPNRDEEIELEGLQFKVASADSRKIIQLRVRVPEQFDTQANQAEQSIRKQQRFCACRNKQHGSVFCKTCYRNANQYKPKQKIDRSDRITTYDMYKPGDDIV